ncbi:YlqD family protein [Ammoniphilus sp. YIM 78166]|uniref:YlqD family protein n=1 Tax=Ammoniphilus sp. YIM 78166 TaxID=1644106 RepID=UPI0010701B09|nr:YlqD family protein [Ammoniphilus sp. YIM 78166]
MKLKRTVLLKMILTPDLREKLLEEYNGYIKKYEVELEQLQFQSKKLLQEALKKGPDAQKVVQERLQKESAARKDKVKHYKEMIHQLALLPDESEILHSELEGEVEVSVGDHWDKLMGKSEIIVRDGIITEIRNGG